MVDPTEDEPGARVIANHAYWLSELKVRDRGAGDGTIDARSHAFGTGDPARLDLTTGASTLPGGSHGPLPYLRRTRAFGAVPKTPKRNRLDVRTRNLSAATVAMRRARLGCDADVRIDSDRPIAIRLASCGRIVSSGCLSSRSPISGRAIGRDQAQRAPERS